MKYLSKYFFVMIKIPSLVEIPSWPGRRELPILHIIVTYLCLGLLWSQFELEVPVEHDAGVLPGPPHRVDLGPGEHLLGGRAEVEQRGHHQQAREHLVSANQPTDLQR